MAGTMASQQYRKIGIFITVFSLVHLSLIPGPNVSTQPAWVGQWDVHLSPYAILAILLLIEGLRKTTTHLEKIVKGVLPSILLVFLGLILFGTLSVSAVGPDTVSMIVPSLLGGYWLAQIFIISESTVPDLMVEK